QAPSRTGAPPRARRGTVDVASGTQGRAVDARTPPRAGRPLPRDGARWYRRRLAVSHSLSFSPEFFCGGLRPMNTYRIVILTSWNLRVERRVMFVEARDALSAEWSALADLDREGVRPLGKLHAVQVAGAA